MDQSNFGAKINYSEIGGHVLTLFFDTCQERCFDEGEVADLKETKRCTGSESADGVRPMGPKNIL